MSSPVRACRDRFRSQGLVGPGSWVEIVRTAYFRRASHGTYVRTYCIFAGVSGSWVLGPGSHGICTLGSTRIPVRTRCPGVLYIGCAFHVRSSYFHVHTRREGKRAPAGEVWWPPGFSPRLDSAVLKRTALRLRLACGHTREMFGHCAPPPDKKHL